MSLPLPVYDGTPETLQFILDKIALAFPSSPSDLAYPIVTSLPTGSSIPNGMVIHYLADATNGVVWALKYRAGSASAHKWEFLGGSSLYNEVLTDQTANSAAYADLATVGPTLTIPLAGDYICRFGAGRYHNDAAAAQNILMALKRGAAATSDNDAAAVFASAAGSGGALGSMQRTLLAANAAASDVYKCQYRNTGGVGNSGWQSRWLEIQPIRVG